MYLAGMRWSSACPDIAGGLLSKHDDVGPLSITQQYFLQNGTRMFSCFIRTINILGFSVWLSLYVENLMKKARKPTKNKINNKQTN